MGRCTLCLVQAGVHRICLLAAAGQTSSQGSACAQGVVELLAGQPCRICRMKSLLIRNQMQFCWQVFLVGSEWGAACCSGVVGRCWVHDMVMCAQALLAVHVCLFLTLMCAGSFRHGHGPPTCYSSVLVICCIKCCNGGPACWFRLFPSVVFLVCASCWPHVVLMS